LPLIGLALRSDLDQGALADWGAQIASKVLWRSEPVWSSTRILWDQQILLLWLLLPPIFIVCGVLALAAPYLVRKTELRDAQCDPFIANQAAVADGHS